MDTYDEFEELLDIGDSYNTFNKLYDKPGDYKKMQFIINEVKRYDVFDFISRVSALNLIPENQNKSILFDALIESLLTLNRSEYNSSIKISSGKFRKIINQLDKMNLKMSLDPAETLFVENVMFYNNYSIFTGINYLPGYCLQMMIDILFLQKNNFHVDFLKSASKLICLVLNISNFAATELGYNLEGLKRLEANNIIIPDNSKLKHMVQLVIVDDNYIQNLIEDDFLIEELYSTFGDGDIETALNAEQQKFFTKPFIKVGDDKTIVLNISVLSSFVFHKIIWLADKYGYKEELINAYNVSVWKDCRKSLSILGHKKIKEKDLGIDLVECSNFKEVLLNVCNNQIMIITCLCDDGKDYSEDMIFDMYPVDHFSELLDKRISYFYEKLSEQGIKQEDIFHIIIINSFGRRIMAGMNTKCFYRPIALNPYDLRCIAINERSNSVFLPRYIRSKSKLQSGVPNLFSELNSIEIYVNSDYSFYLNDDFNPKNNALYIAPGDSIDYIIRAAKKEKRHLVESYNEGYFTEVILNDETRNIYTELALGIPRASLLAKFKNIDIWIYSGEIIEYEELNLYFSIVDAISYWIEECRGIIENYNFVFDIIKLQIKLSGKLKEYYYSVEEKNNWIDMISINKNENDILLTWTPNAFRLLNYKDNSNEQQMIGTILDILGELTIEGNIDKKQLESIFRNHFKKKFFSIDYLNNPCMKPLVDSNFHKVKSEDENELLDDIGSRVLASGKWTYGIVKDEDRPTISNYVVAYLYGLLQEQVKNLNPKYLVELLCYDLEKIMYNLVLFQNRYAYDVACYPEKREEMFGDFNELNKVSRALKFLAEYIAACPPNGTKILGEWQYEKLLAICSLIIEWAYKNDLFYYKIFNTPVEILKSDRVGMKQEEFTKLETINIKVREDQLNYNSSSDFRERLPYEAFPNIDEELNAAFLDEYQFSFDDFCNSIFGMISYGDNNNSEVKKADRSELIYWIVQNNTSLNSDKVEKIIQYISLTKRNDFLKPGRPYRPEDVYPWRFNRELSFTRRPVIIRENEVIWGNRQLFHMLKFTIDLIYEGKLKTRKKKLTTLIGKVSNKRGDDFNNQVYSKINEIGTFVVDKNLKKINHKNIADENGNTLGDIDVLYIIPNRKLIVLSEVKDFNFSKSPYEMDLEYQKMFVDKGDKKCFATKHRRRALWVNEHLEDVKIQYGLEGDGWSIKDIFIVSEAIISNAFYDVGATIVTYGEMTKKRLESI
ncbi:Uncharacterised protein [Clostridium sporogenes]|uniref:Uncharacterized protein n=1 Tax=Clostridium sporogenes TaxID=1509 RepID=A0A7U4JPV2_CLOSG|nr:hypothetical protein [Clostridium sporogenes]AKC63121.1 hypothetical protein CLSPO_c24010 [Clostridium sporogenes]AKJ90331.1 hypothetical protein CLSPOx_12045 [Clostridium sporogenes]KCZ67808.1 hypothetical protein CSPO_7c01510 [Clostridium sporogenes]OOO65520.1 hypothetical protein BS099_14660 [Clostridium sporogenes]SQC04000.1 Uncharacterised protein [Clostridium sporogenes]